MFEFFFYINAMYAYRFNLGQNKNILTSHLVFVVVLHNRYRVTPGNDCFLISCTLFPPNYNFRKKFENATLIG